MTPLFVPLHNQVISLDLPAEGIYFHCNPLGHIVCLHAQNRLAKMTSISNPSACMCVQGPKLHKNIPILWS